MSPAWLLVSLLAAPRVAAPVAAPADVEPSEEAPAAGYDEQAALDVESILTGESREYLEARARLEAHPAEAAEALLDRLAAVPAPIEAERKRLLDVLSALEGDEHLQLFVDELRRSVARAENEREVLQQIDRWLPLVTAQGAKAREPLARLVGDRELSLPARGHLLQALVDVTPGADLSGLVVLVGAGHRTLREGLVRALGRRVKAEEAHRPALLGAIDAELDRAAPAQVPAFVAARSTLTRGSDPAFLERLRGWAKDPKAPFGVRVSAVRGLARTHTEPAIDALAEVASAQLSAPHRGTQAGEVLAWLALRGLPPERARRLVREHDLLADDAPRLAEVAWKVADLPADQSWLRASVQNPWPTVRSAALGRIDGPCPTASVKLLGDRARPEGDDDPAAARAAVQALGRCGAHDTLVDLMTDDDVDIEQRTEAARQLCKRGGPAGADAVAKTLAKGPDTRFARRLAAALRHAPKATPAAVATLCRLAGEESQVGQAASATLVELRVDVAAKCGS
jgi:hypothetical protein